MVQGQVLAQLCQALAERMHLVLGGIDLSLVCVTEFLPVSAKLL